MHALDADFQIGYGVHDEFIPHAILWFLGELAVDADFQGDLE